MKQNINMKYLNLTFPLIKKFCFDLYSDHIQLNFEPFRNDENLLFIEKFLVNIYIFIYSLQIFYLNSRTIIIKMENVKSADENGMG